MDAHRKFGEHKRSIKELLEAYVFFSSFVTPWDSKDKLVLNRGFAWWPCCMAGTIKMFCIRMNILSHRNNIVLFLACNMAAM